MMFSDFAQRLLLSAILALPGALPGVALAAPNDPVSDRVDFARDVLPVLSDKCFACHGPDTSKKGALRLDSYAGATRDLGGYQAIDPNAPEESEILRRIFDKDDPMPPADAEKQLSADERELIARWVRQGGAYAEHWAFVPPRKLPPEGSVAEEGEAIIDAYIAAQFKRRSLAFAPEADRSILARRAALVLTGLPPEPERLRTFLVDTEAGAYERFVDQLLASPRYGEHLARYWLDAVRYGDTHGLHLDNRRGIYPYRDWVVRAFNENLPLDQFITWQLAGDLLPNPTMEQLIATGYVRMNPTTSEGGVLPEEFQAKNNFDRTETLGTVFLGMTLTCARCHTHKYDPITHTEYYRLLAFFNSTAEKPLDGNAYDYEPLLKVPENQGAWAEWMELVSERDRLLAMAESVLPEERDEKVWATRDWRISAALSLDDPPPAADEGEAITQFPGALEAKLPPPDQAVWISFLIQTDQEQSLWLTGSGGPESQVLLHGEPVPPAAAASPDQESIAGLLTVPPGTHRVQVKLAGLRSESAIELWLADPSPALALARKWNAANDEARLALLADAEGPLAQLRLRKQAGALAARMASAQTNFTTTLIARDLDEPRPTHVLQRGEYNMPTGDPLEPGILQVMNPFPTDAPPNRLGLARWLASRDHPLVSRVLINRVWQNIFGLGLVRTPEDFGLQGQQPTHPRLLDWLAVELQDSGWDLKHMIRLMVTSRTFRQSSAHRPEISDPENRLWARGPSHRLDAEVLRDLGLWAGGLLDPAMGGEGVKPYQPAGLWEAMAHPASNTKKYERDHGTRLYRRSLYVYWKRTSPHPMMTLFDAPSRETSCVRRSRTNTSLQSLGLLNETQRLEMARALAERLLEAHDSDDARFDLLFTLLASRSPLDSERAACRSLLTAMRERYRSDPEDAQALLEIGDAPRDESLNAADHAAWTQVASTVLASDAAITLY